MNLSDMLDLGASIWTWDLATYAKKYRYTHAYLSSVYEEALVKHCPAETSIPCADLGF